MKLEMGEGAPPRSGGLSGAGLCTVMCTKDQGKKSKTPPYPVQIFIDGVNLVCSEHPPTSFCMKYPPPLYIFVQTNESVYTPHKLEPQTAP